MTGAFVTYSHPVGKPERSSYARSPWLGVAATICTVPIMLAVLLALLALGLLPIALRTEPASTVVYDLPPPAPPPAPTASPPVPRPAAAATPERPHAPAIRPVRAVSDRSAPIVLAPVPLPLALSREAPAVREAPRSDPVAASGTALIATDGGIAGREPAPVPALALTPAAWIRRPSRADFLREWPAAGHGLAAAVHIVMVCEVRRSGHPYRCEVARESLPGRGFGEGAIRLAERAVVRSVISGVNRTDMLVTIPLTFDVAGPR